VNWNFFYTHPWQTVRWPVIALATVAAAWLGWQVWPVPDAYLRISTGSTQGAYFRMAKRYEELLAARGVRVEVLPSEGTPDNLKRLEEAQADLAFAQGGFGMLGTSLENQNSAQIQTLANVGIEPLWLVTRKPSLTNLMQLSGLKVGVGSGQSGSRKVLLRLLELHRLSDKEVQLVGLNGFDLIKALDSGQVDAVFHVATPESPVVRGLLDIAGVHLVHLERASAIVERLPYLEPRLLAQGSLMGRNKQPEKDTTLLTTYASLVARADLDPALQRQVLAAAQQVHSGAGSFHRAGEFPSLRQLDFPAPLHVLDSADYLSGKLPWWEGKFSFVQAQWLERLVVIGLPLMALALMLCIFVPRWIESRVRGQLDALYGQLQFLEEDMNNTNLIRLDYERMRRQLVALDEKIARLSIPSHLAQRWLVLRSHVDFVNRSSYRMRGR
jgi:uncharacterized protein